MQAVAVRLTLCAITAGLATIGAVHAEPVTVGTHNSSSCFPLMCNNSGSNVGQSIDYQQVFASTEFSGPKTIDLISWHYDSTAGGTSTLLGGLYTAFWGYAAPGTVNNLSPNLSSNYVSSRTLIANVAVPPGGFDISSGITLSLDAAQRFTYDPALGNLLLEIVASNQDNVPEDAGNGFNQADITGNVTSRAFCVGSDACLADSAGLVTTFDTSVSEPGTLMLFVLGMVGLARVFRRGFVPGSGTGF